MKKLLNIILLLFIVAICNGQTKKSLLYYDRPEVDEMVTALVNANTKLQQFKDSILSIENQGQIQAPGSFVAVLDTAYVYIIDSLGNSVEVRKNGAYIDVITAKETARISSFFGDQRRVFFMDSTKTSAAIVEDSLNFLVNLPDLGLQITGDK